MKHNSRKINIYLYR